MLLEISNTLIYLVGSLFLGFLAYLQIKQYQLLRSLERKSTPKYGWLGQIFTGFGSKITFMKVINFYYQVLSIIKIIRDFNKEKNNTSNNRQVLSEMPPEIQALIDRAMQINASRQKIIETNSCEPRCNPCKCGLKADTHEPKIDSLANLLKSLSRELEDDPLGGNAEAINNLIITIKKLDKQPNLSIIDQIYRLKKKVSDITPDHEDGIRIMVAFDAIIKDASELVFELKKLKREKPKNTKGESSKS